MLLTNVYIFKQNFKLIVDSSLDIIWRIISEPTQLQALIGRMDANLSDAMVPIPEENESIFSEDPRSEHPKFERGRTDESRAEELKLSNDRRGSLGLFRPETESSEASPPNREGTQKERDREGRLSARALLPPSIISLTEMAIPKQNAPATSQGYILHVAGRTRNNSMLQASNSNDDSGSSERGVLESVKDLVSPPKASKTDHLTSPLAFFAPKDQDPSPPSKTAFRPSDVPASPRPPKLIEPASKTSPKRPDPPVPEVSKSTPSKNGKTPSEESFSDRSLKEQQSDGSVDEPSSATKTPGSSKLKAKIQLILPPRGYVKPRSSKSGLKTEAKIIEIFKTSQMSRSLTEKREDLEAKSAQTKQISELLASINSKENSFRKPKTKFKESND